MCRRRGARRSETMKVVVVGAGFGGLAAAALLARKGYSVTLLEKNREPGGRARQFSEGGYTFDMGPSWYLMPEVFTHYFEVIGKRMDDYYRLKSLDPSFTIYFRNRSVKIHREDSKNSHTYDSLEEDGYRKMQKYLGETEKLYNTAMSGLLYREYNGARSMVSPRIMGKAAKVHLLESMGDFNSSYFSSAEMRQITGFSSVFLGGTPKNIPAVYGMVNHSIFRDGVYYPVGGFGKMVEGMVNLCKDMGVETRFGFEVTTSGIRDSRMMWVSSREESIEGDVFLFNADYAHSDSVIIDNSHSNFSKKHWERSRLAPSAILAYCGVRGILPLEHHNIFMGDQADEHYQSLMKMDDEIPEGFSFYASLRSKSDDTVAPPGRSNLFILIPVSANFNDSGKNRERYIRAALGRIQSVTGFDIMNSLDYIRTYSRTDFVIDYNAYRGSAFGLSQTMFQTAGFRPPMRSRKLKNVFYAGQYTHPGIGVPMVFIAAEIVSSLIGHSFPQKSQ